MSQTEYVHNILVACPESLIEPGNHFAVAVGESAGSFETFGNLNYQDSDGNKYSVIWTGCTDLLFAYALSQLQHRDFAPENWSFELATQAQMAVNLWFGPTEQQPEIPQATTSQIVGVVNGGEPQAILAAMGLIRVPEEIEN